MYVPENDAQMHDILSALRLYAAMNNLPQLAEQLDDAILCLRSEVARKARTRRAATLSDTL